MDSILDHRGHEFLAAFGDRKFKEELHGSRVIDATAAQGPEVLRATLLLGLQRRGGEADREGTGATCRSAPVD